MSRPKKHKGPVWPKTDSEEPQYVWIFRHQGVEVPVDSRKLAERAIELGVELVEKRRVL